MKHHPENPQDTPNQQRRTGPTTGNKQGNDLPSDAKTTRDTRQVGAEPTASPASKKIDREASQSSCCDGQQ